MSPLSADPLILPARPSSSSTKALLDEIAVRPSDTLSYPIESRVHYRLAESHSRFLHVVEQGTTLRRSGTRIRITKKDKVLLEVPATKLQGVILYGNIQVSTQCLRNLLEEGVWLSFFSRSGFYKGRLQPPIERGGNLRLRQWERSRDADFCLSFARAVV